jgi:copper oxidase (laccase) domain-containing protein
MLTFSLKELFLYISQRDDGNFRHASQIKKFLQAQPKIREENFNLIHLQLENKKQVIVLEEKNFLSKESTQIFLGDALLTNLKKGNRGTNKTLISMVVGDCFPLIFFDQKTKNIAMIHAGWEPLYLGILKQVWQQMEDLWELEAENFWAFLGPGIRAESYCVLNEPRQSQHADWKNFIKKVVRSKKNQEQDKKKNMERELWQLDLPGFIKYFLTSKGLKQEQLIDSGLDTYALPDQFFSYRRSQEQSIEGKKQLALENNGRFFVACQLPLSIT